MSKTYSKEEFNAIFDITAADWDTYRGNNHLRINPPKITFGGSVSFKRHLGKPLSESLWEDLIYRFCISGLGVFRWNESQWCLGRSSGYCIIQLDENENVYNIHVYPYQR